MLETAAKSPSHSQGPHSWDDLLALEEDDLRELLDGHLLEFEVPTYTHEHIVGMLSFYLTGWALANRAGQVLPSGYKVRIGERRGYMPDVQFYRRGNLPKDQEQGLARGRPDLVVEVVSPSSQGKDRVTKLNDYAQIGVPEYWILDPAARSLERLVLREGTYFIAQALLEDAMFRPDAFPGLEIPLARVWQLPEDILADEPQPPPPEVPPT